MRLVRKKQEKSWRSNQIGQSLTQQSRQGKRWKIWGVGPPANFMKDTCQIYGRDTLSKFSEHRWVVSNLRTWVLAAPSEAGIIRGGVQDEKTQTPFCFHLLHIWPWDLRVLKNGITPGLVEIIFIILTVGSAHSIPDSFSGPMQPDSGDDPDSRISNLGHEKERILWKQLTVHSDYFVLFSSTLVSLVRLSQGTGGPNSLGKAGKNQVFQAVHSKFIGDDTMQVILPCMFSSENSECCLSDTASRTLTPSNDL